MKAPGKALSGPKFSKTGGTNRLVLEEVDTLFTLTEYTGVCILLYNDRVALQVNLKRCAYVNVELCTHFLWDDYAAEFV